MRKKYIKKENPENNGGRPKREFTAKQWQEFESLCSIQATKIEICDWFGLEDDTLDRLLSEKYNLGFSEVYAKKRSKGKISLRRKQWQLADTNPAMAIFLGKNYLGQKDKQEFEHSGGVKIIRDNI